MLYGLAIIAIAASIFYVKHVFSQNEERRLALIQKDAQIESLKAGFEAYLKLNQEITDAVKKIKITSNNYVTTVENSPPPADGTRFVFMSASSVRTQTYLAPGRFSNNSSGSGGANKR